MIEAVCWGVAIRASRMSTVPQLSVSFDSTISLSGSAVVCRT
jgi:hypothetical protein